MAIGLLLVMLLVCIDMFVTYCLYRESKSDRDRLLSKGMTTREMVFSLSKRVGNIEDKLSRKKKVKSKVSE